MLNSFLQMPSITVVFILDTQSIQKDLHTQFHTALHSFFLLFCFVYFLTKCIKDISISYSSDKCEDKEEES